MMVKLPFLNVTGRAKEPFRFVQGGSTPPESPAAGGTIIKARPTGNGISEYHIFSYFHQALSVPNQFGHPYMFCRLIKGRTDHSPETDRSISVTLAVHQ